MTSTQAHARRRAAGFSLVELMVGMALGLLSVLIITQVMSLFEAQRRTTTGSADAQTNGGIALFSIAREAQLAGYGLIPTTDSGLECTAVNYNTTGIGSLTPISITDGTATASVPASDSITIRYGSSTTGGSTTQITATAGSVATVTNNLGCSVGDAVLVTSGASCSMTTASAVSAVGASPISVSLNAMTLATVGANLACLGQWSEVTYAVNAATGNLDKTTVVNGVSTTVPSVVGVVNLQAQYGVAATANSNAITQWVDASGGTWAAPTVANRNRIKAIRVAVVARNAKIEPGTVTAACSSTSAAAPAGLCAWEGSVASPAPAVDLSPGNADWAKYRYRVFETIIPLRNVIWSKDTL